MVSKKLHKKIIMKNNNLYIGILTGTSMDTIDCGIFNFDNNCCDIISFYENEYPLKLKEKIINNIDTLRKDYSNNPLHKELAIQYSVAINNMLNNEKINKNEIAAIGMHGQTISHEKHNDENISIQIGCPETLKNETKIKVVSEFRQHDIRNGGEGAPLAPLFHDYIFKRKEIKRVIVNIGGISNISFLTHNKNTLHGFDSGPGNILIDLWTKKKYNLNYDDEGKISSSHKTSNELLEVFMDDNFFKMKPPKSTSTEYFSYNWIIEKLKLINLDLSNGEVLASLTKLTALSIVKNIRDYAKDCDEIYICGGGAFNKTIISEIRSETKRIFSKKIIVETTEKINFHPKKIEAGLFAWLAMSKLCNKKLDYSKITGAKKPEIIGEIFFTK